jgi:hypothetical protein
MKNESEEAEAMQGSDSTQRFDRLITLRLGQMYAPKHSSQA